MTVAVLMREPTGEIFWFWLAVVVAVGAMGAGPVLSAIFSACRKPSARRIVGAVAFAIVLTLTLGVATASASIFGPCDPFWIMFWICIAP
jgi:hypothetical protein